MPRSCLRPKITALLTLTLKFDRKKKPSAIAIWTWIGLYNSKSAYRSINANRYNIVMIGTRRESIFHNSLRSVVFVSGGSSSTLSALASSFVSSTSLSAIMYIYISIKFHNTIVLIKLFNLRQATTSRGFRYIQFNSPIVLVIVDVVSLLVQRYESRLNLGSAEVQSKEQRTKNKEINWNRRKFKTNWYYLANRKIMRWRKIFSYIRFMAKPLPPRHTPISHLISIILDLQRPI